MQGIHRWSAWLAFFIGVVAGAPNASAQLREQPDLALHGAGLPTTMVRQPDGRLIVAGLFTVAGDTAVRYLVRYNLDGSVDATWRPPLERQVDDLALDSQGRLYVSLRWAPRPGVPPGSVRQVRRIDITGDGSLDAGFLPTSPPDTIDDGFAMLLDEAGGALYASYTVASGGYVVRRHRLADASHDTGFVLQLDSLLYDVVRSGEHLVIAGSFRNVNGVPRKGLARVDRLTGALDTSWDPAASTTATFNTVRSLFLDGASHVFAGGVFTNLGGAANRGLARVSLLDASADPAWSTPITGQVTAITRDAQGRLVIGGTPQQIGALPWLNTVARFSAAGVHESTWNDPAIINASPTRALVVLPDDDVLALHYDVGDQPSRVLRHAADTGIGVPISADDLLGTPYVTRVLPLGDGGRLLASNNLHRLEGVTSVGALRLDAAGLPDPAWRSTLGQALRFATISDADLNAGHVYLTGSMFYAASRVAMRRLSLADGTLDAGWSLQTVSTNPSAVAAAIDPAAGFIYVSGSLGSGSVSRFRLSDGVRDASWNPAITTVNHLEIHDGFLYAGGNFTTVGGADLPRLARFALSGSATPDPTWRPAPASLTALALDPAGEWIYTGGNVGDLVALSRYRVSDAARDVDWAPLQGRAGSITRLVTDADGDTLYAIGSVASGCDAARYPVTRIHSGPNRVDALWSVTLDAQGSILDALVEHDDVMLVGFFETIQGEARQSVASLGPGDTLFADGAGDTGGCVRPPILD